MEVAEHRRCPDQRLGDDARALLAAIVRELMAECRARLAAEEAPVADAGVTDVPWLFPATSQPAT